MATVEIECGGILFDLDGTLIDSGEAVHEAWTKFANEIGRDPDEILARCHGVRTTEVIEGLGLNAPARETAVEVESYIVNADSKPIPGAVALLNSLPTSAWAVVTSSLTETAWSRFELTDLPAPEHIVSADDVALGKPDPSGYLMGASLLGVPPANCLIFEDAVAGIGAANAAGIRSVALTTTSTAPELEGANFIVPDLTHVRLLKAVESTEHGWSLTLEVGLDSE